MGLMAYVTANENGGFDYGCIGEGKDGNPIYIDLIDYKNFLEFLKINSFSLHENQRGVKK